MEEKPNKKSRETVPLNKFFLSTQFFPCCAEYIVFSVNKQYLVFSLPYGIFLSLSSPVLFIFFIHYLYTVGTVFSPGPYLYVLSRITSRQFVKIWRILSIRSPNSCAVSSSCGLWAVPSWERAARFWTRGWTSTWRED